MKIAAGNRIKLLSVTLLVVDEKRKHFFREGKLSIGRRLNLNDDAIMSCDYAFVF